MKSLIDPTKQQIRPEPIEASKESLPTKIDMPAHLTEFMNFMAGLPTMYKDFEEAGKMGEESVDIFPEPEDLEGESPYPAPVRKQHRTGKPAVLSAGSKQIMQGISDSSLKEGDKQYLLKLGMRESSFNPVDKTADKKYKGLYQFDKDTLNTVGMTMDQYKGSVEAQNKAALLYKKHNLGILRNYFKFIGRQKDGTTITENGLAAAAHLLGAGTVMDYLNGTRKTPLGKKGFVDGLGTHISEYFELFA
jgi:hypothetical protein